jgi:hypothetical protein
MIARVRHTVLVVVLAIACAAHCGRATDTLPAPPVATLDVSLSRSTVAAGHLIDVTYRFTVAADAPQLDDDYAVFVHAVEESGKSIWADDHAPAVPARQWKPGDRIEYTRPMFVSRRAYPGPHGLDIGLYSPRTGRRVPLNTPGGRGDSSRLARFEVTSPGPTPVVLFVKGWHLPERESEPGMVPSAEWHWSTRESLLWCANPRRDARFVLHLDQPLQGDEAARQVQVIIGGSLVDSFALAPGAREVRRVPVAGALLGTDDIVPITLRLDRASVPAPAAGAALADGRELGVRVFDALLEPQ